MINGLSKKATAFLVLLVFILPMISFIVPTLAPLTNSISASAATPLYNKAGPTAATTYRSAVTGFAGAGPTGGVIAQAFDGDGGTNYQTTNGLDYSYGNTYARTAVRFTFQSDAGSKANYVNKIYVKLGNSSNSHMSAQYIWFAANNSAVPPAVAKATSSAPSGTTGSNLINGKLYMAASATLAKDALVGTSTGVVDNFSILPTAGAARLNLTASGTGIREYYFIPDVPVDPKSVILFTGRSFSTSTSAIERCPIFEMQLFDVRAENLVLTADTEAVPSQVLLNPIEAAQNIALPTATVKDANGDLVNATMSSAVTITLSATDGGLVPNGVSLDTSVPASPKLVVAPDASVGSVRLTWGYTDSATNYPTEQTSAVPIIKDIVIGANVPVTGIHLNKTTTEISAGNTETLTATVEPTDALNKNVMWLSSDDNIAIVDSNGLVTAVSEGSADITATTYDGGYIASCTVTVTGAVVNFAALSAAISDATVLINSKTVGLANGNVPQEAKDVFQAAILAATSVVEDVNATQLEVDAVVSALGLATTAFNDSIIVVDKTILALAITDAISLLNSKTVGLANGNVPQAAYDAFQTAISAATTVNEDANATQAEVDTGVSELGFATIVFNDLIIVVNKDILQTAISDANTLINNTPVGTIVGNVPQVAQDDFLAVITQATGVYENANATQAQVDAEVIALASATIAFNNAMIKETPKYAVSGTVSILTGGDLTKVSIVAKQAGILKETVAVLADGTFVVSLEPGVYTFEIGRTGYLAKIFANFTVTTDVSQVLSAATISLIAGDVVTTDQNTIDLQDLQRILSNFGLTSSDLSFNAVYDLNDDGAVNLIDLQAVLKNFGSVQ